MHQEDKNSFWKKQFSGELTTKQYWFDVIFGIVIPILCLAFDPAVFRVGILGGAGFLYKIRVFAYLSIGLGLLILAIWLALRPTSKFLVAALSGVFLAGAILALALGIVLLPISLLGLMIVIGVLGFIPFLTAFVFLRNGVRALMKIESEMNKALLIGIMLLGIILVVGFPLVINWKASALVSQSVQIVIHSAKEEEINSAVGELQSAFWCSDPCYDEIVWAYSDEESEARREILAKVYFTITEKHIEDRAQRFLDD